MQANCFKKKKDESDQANQASDSKPKVKEKEEDTAEVVLSAVDAELKHLEDYELVNSAYSNVCLPCLPDDGIRFGPMYVQKWARFNPDGTFAKWKTRMVQDRLPNEVAEVEEVALVTTEDSDDNVNLYVESEMRMFLKKVAAAKKLKAMNVGSWVDAVEQKLRDINITTVTEVWRGIATMNSKINKNRDSMMHIRTLYVMSQVAEDEAEEQLSQWLAEVTKLTQELVTYQTERTSVLSENKKSKMSPDETASTDNGWATVNEEDTSLLNMDIKKSPKTRSRTRRGLGTQVRPVT
jgi:flagellar hook-length control protein FliK